MELILCPNFHRWGTIVLQIFLKLSGYLRRNVHDLPAHTVLIPSTAMASVVDLSPVTFSAQEYLTSELLRTL